MDDVVADLKKRARPWRRGNAFQDFSKGKSISPPLGPTTPRSHGFLDLVVLLLFNTAFGLSVEDLSEIGSPFLGVDQLTYQPKSAR